MAAVTVFLPTDITAAAIIAGLLAVVVTVGFLLNRFGIAAWSQAVAWGLVLVASVGMLVAVCEQPAGLRMVAIILAVLYGMKAVVAVESRRKGRQALRLVQWLPFCLLWFGMRPDAFLTLPGPPRGDARRLILLGLRSLILGLVFAITAYAIRHANVNSQSLLLRDVLPLGLLMVAFSLIVHFGLFDLLAGFGRLCGADTRKLFRAPLLSRSLTEFWSRRWNIAFSEMTATAVFRPLKSRLGSPAARTVAFLYSGLLHEIAISVPVRAGYGLPFCYFLLHAVAMQWESTAPLKRRLQSPLFARLWTVAWILLPLPLLFHRPFCEGILLPLLG
jgi:alginate O-acetyltransferase complex protein AlgI